MIVYFLIGRDYKHCKKEGELPTWYSFMAGGLFIEVMGWYIVLATLIGG